MLEQTSPALREAYDRAFFAAQVEGSSRSASVVVPHILRVFPGTSSVIDLGCGTGAWLRHFKACGVPHVLGVDGGAPDDGMLQIKRTEYRNLDLARPLHLPERFDLATSFEVAEHLPPSAARTFVDNLCRLADAVVFSAAIPGQGGTRHINERWQTYWRDLFETNGYELFDVLRPVTWYDRRVEWWYAQNMLVFVNRERQDLVQQMRANAIEQQRSILVDIVHPRCFEAFRMSLEAVQPPASIAPKIDNYGDIASLEALKEQLHITESNLNAILHSASWRITGPLRRLMQSSPRVRRCLRAVLAPIWRTARFTYRSVVRG
jgi:SAM-dependent methyltransferase